LVGHIIQKEFINLPMIVIIFIITIKQPDFSLYYYPNQVLELHMIRHTVIFTLSHSTGSEAEINFLKTGQKLADIPTVRNFECLRQISEKNNYDFGFSMEFDSNEDYQTYNEHPFHVEFVETRWIPEVLDFMEIDYEPCSVSER